MCVSKNSSHNQQSFFFNSISSHNQQSFLYISISQWSINALISFAGQVILAIAAHICTPSVFHNPLNQTHCVNYRALDYHNQIYTLHRKYASLKCWTHCVNYHVLDYHNQIYLTQKVCKSQMLNPLCELSCTRLSCTRLSQSDIYTLHRKYASLKCC